MHQDDPLGSGGTSRAAGYRPPWSCVQSSIFLSEELEVAMQVAVASDAESPAHAASLEVARPAVHLLGE